MESHCLRYPLHPLLLQVVSALDTSQGCLQQHFPGLRTLLGPDQQALHMYGEKLQNFIEK